MSRIILHFFLLENCCHFLDFIYFVFVLKTVRVGTSIAPTGAIGSPEGKICAQIDNFIH